MREYIKDALIYTINCRIDTCRRELLEADLSATQENMFKTRINELKQALEEIKRLETED